MFGHLELHSGLTLELSAEVMILPQRRMRQHSTPLRLWREGEVPSSVRRLTGPLV